MILLTLENNNELSDMTTEKVISRYDRVKKILLVEDDSSYARLVEILLGDSDLIDCKINNTPSLKECLLALEADLSYDAILLDLSLPDSNGFITLEKLIDAFPGQNIIVLTGRSDKDLGLKSVKAGAQDFLVKGEFDGDQLAKSLRYSIERNQILKRLEETQTLARIGNWECAPSQHYFSASDEVYRMFGFSPRSTKFTCNDLMDADCPFHLFLQIQEETLEAGGELQKELKIVSSDQIERFINIRCNANEIEKDFYVYTGVVQDITDLKLADQAKIKSQQRYQDIFSQSKDTIYTARINGQLIDSNRSTLQLLGLSQDAISQLENVHTLFFSEDQREQFLSSLQHKDPVKDFELRVLRGDGQYRSCLISTSFGSNDEEGTYNGIIRDITERKQAEDLRKARDIAEQTTKVREQVIAGVSHDMRTPMNAIIGMLNLLIRTELNTTQKEYITSIKQSSKILLGIINDILQASSIKNNTLSFEQERFSLKALTKNLYEMLEHKVVDKNVILHFEMGEDLPDILWGDQLRLNQILYNLLGNAVKFTEKGSVNLKVNKLCETAEEVSLKFSVEDTGIGIPKDKLDVIFQPFTRVYQKGKLYEGTGLGLAIVKNLIGLQGGSISASSIPGHGSTFFFELKFRKSIQEGEVAKNDLEVQNEAAPQQFISDDKLVYKILIVEDHKMNQIVAQKTIEEKWKNAEIVIASHGKEAVDILEQQAFDIILMDIQMPIMDGIEATEYIRDQMPPNINNIPILAMTAHVLLNDDETYYKSKGINDYILKPFEPEDLFNKIEVYIKESKRLN